MEWQQLRAVGFPHRAVERVANDAQFGPDCRHNLRRFPLTISDPTAIGRVNPDSLADALIDSLEHRNRYQRPLHVVEFGVFHEVLPSDCSLFNTFGLEVMMRLKGLSRVLQNQTPSGDSLCCALRNGI
jgi:hypothetical protein